MTDQNDRDRITGEHAQAALAGSPWTIQRGDRIAARFAFDDFAEALSAVVTIGALAERANHHPDLHLENFNRLRVELTSHDVGGLSARDLALAAEITALGFRADARASG